MRLLSILVSVSLCATPLSAQVATGIDVLEQQNFAPLRERLPPGMAVTCALEC